MLAIVSVRKKTVDDRRLCIFLENFLTFLALTAWIPLFKRNGHTHRQKSELIFKYIEKKKIDRYTLYDKSDVTIFGKSP